MSKGAQAANQWADPEMRARMLEGMRRAREAKAAGLVLVKPKAPREDGRVATPRGITQPGRPGDHRCTPRRIWVAAKHAAGIERWDLDPASNRQSAIPADTAWYGESEADNGLMLDWFGNTWLNPPFSAMDVWTERSISQLENLVSLTFLGPGDSSTVWWRKWTKECHAWAAWKGRDHFPLPDQTKGGSPGPIHLFYHGPNVERWRRVMEHVGCVTYLRRR